MASGFLLFHSGAGFRPSTVCLIRKLIRNRSFKRRHASPATCRAGNSLCSCSQNQKKSKCHHGSLRSKSGSSVSPSQMDTAKTSGVLHWHTARLETLGFDWCLVAAPVAPAQDKARALHSGSEFPKTAPLRRRRSKPPVASAESGARSTSSSSACHLAALFCVFDGKGREKKTTGSFQKFHHAKPYLDPVVQWQPCPSNLPEGGPRSAIDTGLQ